MAVLRRHGSKAALYMDAALLIPATPVYELVASLNGYTLDMTRDRVDVTSFGDVNKTYVQGLADIKGTMKGFWEALANRVLFDAAMGDTAVGLKLVPCELDASSFFAGLAYIDASLEVAADGAVSISGSFGAAGPWAYEPTGVVLAERARADVGRRLS